MGLDADVIAIGKFKVELASHLDYPEESYGDTPEGAEIITALFFCNTSDASERLADALGVDPWAFHEHHLNPHKVDMEKLWELANEEAIECEGVEDFIALREAGFAFHYRPNG